MISTMTATIIHTDTSRLNLMCYMYDDDDDGDGSEF